MVDNDYIGFLNSQIETHKAAISTGSISEGTITLDEVIVHGQEIKRLEAKINRMLNPRPRTKKVAEPEVVE